MNDARSRILGRLSAQQREDAPLPALNQTWVDFEDPLEHFVTTLETVGGRAHHASGIGEARAAIQGLAPVQQASQIVSMDEQLLAGNLALDSVDDPHQLGQVDLALCRAEFWVAENGAVWVPQGAIKHRVILFITQHLVLVVPRSQGVMHMHQAYERIQGFQDSFGVFISGPSKTADIEQSLVIGAHGARSLHVIITDE
jgi:L-lactate dehydrogenase complex protein LldG